MMRTSSSDQHILIHIISAGVAVSAFSLPAISDPIRRYQVVQVTYEESEKNLRVEIVPIELRWNDYAGMDRLEREQNKFALWNRVSYDQVRFIKAIDPAVKTFKTSAGDLVVKVIPIPGNTNGNGRCGAHIGADVSASLGGHVLLGRRRVISPDCFNVRSFPVSLPVDH